MPRVEYSLYSPRFNQCIFLVHPHPSFRTGVLSDDRMKLDYVLGLKIEDFLERRLQTQVILENLPRVVIQRLQRGQNFCKSA